MHTVLYSFTLPYLWIVFWNVLHASSSPAVAPSAKRPAPVAKQGYVTAFILSYCLGPLVSAADNDCWRHIWLGELWQKSFSIGVRHSGVPQVKVVSGMGELRCTTPLLIGLQWGKLTRNNYCHKNGFLYRQFVILSRNYREIRYFGREIRYFGREITAKSTILQLRGTAKFGQKNRAKHRSLNGQEDRAKMTKLKIQYKIEN